MPAQVKPSRLLLRLESEIANATSQVEGDCKRAERAAYLARLGRFDEARAEVVAVRTRNSLAPDLELTIRVNLAEGLLAYFSNLGVSTTDRVQRAYVLSASASVGFLRSICAAWLAQWDYSKLDMVNLAKHIQEAFAFAAIENYAARSRASLVAAQALHLAGRFDLAKVWYARARVYAVEEGDEVTISAVMHNMAWLHMLTMRQAVLSGTAGCAFSRYALLSAESVENFDLLTGDSSWDELKPILKAQILSLQGKPSEAMVLYEQFLSAADQPSRLQAYLLADKAWCHVQVNEKQQAAQCADMAIENLVEETQIDDLAATHSRLADVFARLGDLSREIVHRSKASKAWGQHLAMQSQTLELLETIDYNVKGFLQS